MLSLGLFIGCGPEAPFEGGETRERIERMVGTIRLLDAQETISAQETAIIRKACLDLQRKKNAISDFANTNVKLQYTSGVRGCAEEQISEQTPYFLKVANLGGRYIYQHETVQPPFNNVVSADDSVMGEVCQHVESAIALELQPARTLSTSVDPVWIYAETGGNCAGADEANCVYVETGLAVGGSSERYRVRDAKSFAVSAEEDATRGFVLERRQISVCAGNDEQTILRKMSFVGIEN